MFTPAEAREYEEKVKNKNPALIASLGYAFGEGNTQPDWSVAANWYRKAAEQGSLNARMELGKLYYAGKGVDKDLTEAYYWLRASHLRECGALSLRKKIGEKLNSAQIKAVQTRLENAGWTAPQPVDWK